MASISPKFLYEIEMGNKGFSAQTLSMIAKSLGVSCDYILFGNVKLLNKGEMDYYLSQFPQNKIEEIVDIVKIIYRLSLS